VLFDLGDEVLLDRLELDDALFFRVIDTLEDDVDEFEELLDVLFGKANMPRMTLGGMYCAYWVPAFTTSSPAMVSSNFEQSSRIIGSSALIGPGAKAGRISRARDRVERRSEVIGGCQHRSVRAGRARWGRPLPMTTLRLVKFVVSFAISETPAWVAGNQPPP